MWRDFDLVKLSHFHIASKNNFFEIRISQGMIVRVLLCFHGLDNDRKMVNLKGLAKLCIHSKFFKTEDGLQVSSHF